MSRLDLRFLHVSGHFPGSQADFTSSLDPAGIVKSRLEHARHRPDQDDLMVGIASTSSGAAISRTNVSLTSAIFR
jgi:hypothetical protein